ncbi:AdoMet_MTases domain containing protein [Candidatus Nanopelagicaceae bacterium]
MNQGLLPSKCFVCGTNKFEFQEILWKELISEWELLQSEVDYINRQQGLACFTSKSNLRSIALAKSFLLAVNSNKTLNEYSKTLKARRLNILEVNEAGNLHSTLRKFKKLTFAEYPEIDLHDLPYSSDCFDFVIHSDTLEHIERPLVALQQIHRVLKKGGKTIFTTPIIIDRLTRSRSGLPNSYHGASDIIDDGMLVTYEYGADFWKYLAEVGFTDIRIITEMYPAGIAFVCTK